MNLESNNIYLRPLKLKDANGNYPDWLNDKKVTKYNSHGNKLYTKAMAIEYIKDVTSRDNIQVFAIILKKNRQHIGNISLQNINTQELSAEFAILIGKTSIYGMGYGYEASKLLFSYGFNTLKLHRIYCGTTKDNIGMQKLALKLNMQKKSIRQNIYIKNGKYSDIIEYEIVR